MAALLFGVSLACVTPPAATPAQVGSAAPAESATPMPPDASASASSAPPAASSSASMLGVVEPARACPNDMVHIEVEFCKKQVTRCAAQTVAKNNHHQICHHYLPPTKCSDENMTHLSFCIDRYEFPNKEGAHPVIHTNWYDAASTCHSLGKRLCFDSEWTAACEGPDKTPFPYGWDRDPTACNINLPFTLPYNDRMYSKNPATQRRELNRLDRALRSGAMPRCVSGFGVFDMTGNADEWVNNDRKEAGGIWAALKGGSYIEARNACRPRTSSHEPKFRFYTLSFRCCKDVDETAPGSATVAAKPQRRVSPVSNMLIPRVPEPGEKYWDPWIGGVVQPWE